MQEVTSLPQHQNRNWVSLLVFAICAVGIAISLITEDVVSFSTSASLFAGWLITSGVTRNYVRVTFAAVIIGSVFGSLIDAMTFSQPLLERNFESIRWQKIVAYAIAGCAGAFFGLFRAKHS